MIGDKFKLGPNREKRLTRASLVVPICVGNVSTSIAKKTQAVQGVTHEWVVYLRSPDNTDLSLVISKVSFTLHSSFAIPVRDATKPPYEVKEQGWGEFEVGIKVEFCPDAMEPPYKTTHKLKLFEEDATTDERNQQLRKPVIRETYDELVFWEPTEEFYNRVKDQLHAKAAGGLSCIEVVLPQYKEQVELNALLAARNRVAQERANESKLGAAV